MNIAIFGSAFNPPTKGHEDAIKSVLAPEYNVDKVVLVPAYKHAFNKKMIDYRLRVEMLDAFVADINDKRVSILAIEHDIATDDRPVYTFDLLTYLQAEVFINAQLHFVIGPDNVNNWHKFYKAEEIKRGWNLIKVSERKNIRSTMVREALKNNLPIDHLVTPNVLRLIQQHSLYL